LGFSACTNLGNYNISFSVNIFTAKIKPIICQVGLKASKSW